MTAVFRRGGTALDSLGGSPSRRLRMAKAKSDTKGIFCLEGDWRDVKDRTSVEPILRLLETMCSYKVPYFHHDVGTLAEFHFYLKKWTGRQFDGYPILYLAFHGEPGSIAVGEGRNKTLKLDYLAEQLEGACKGRVIHFGTCSTLDVNGHELNSFVRRTGACAVSGFRTDVNWLLSAAFDLLVLGHLQDVSFTKAGMGKLQRRLKQDAPGLRKTLGYRMWPKAE